MGNIPLPALNVATPEFQSPMESRLKAMQMKNIMQRAKMGDIELKNAQQDQEDRKIFQEEFIKAGGDYNKMIQGAMARGASVNMLQKLKDIKLVHDQAATKATGEQIDTVEKLNNQLAGDFAAYKQAPDAEKPAFYQQTKTKYDAIFKQLGVPNPLPQNPPGPEFYGMIEAQLMGGKAWAEKARQAKLDEEKPPTTTAAGNMVYDSKTKTWTQVGEKKPTPANINYAEGTIIGSDGVTRSIYDPNLAESDKALVAAAKRAHGEAASEQLAREDRMSARQEERQAKREAALSSPTKTMIEVAPSVKDMAEKVMQQAKKVQLGPLSGRWNELWAGRIGADNPDFVRLRTNVNLLRTLLLRMHVGARGGVQLLGEFKTLIDSGKQTPDNLQAAVEEIDNYADSLISFGAEHGHNVGKKGTEKSKAKSDPLGIF